MKTVLAVFVTKMGAECAACDDSDSMYAGSAVADMTRYP